MGGRGASSSLTSGKKLEFKIENGFKYFRTNIYGKEWVTPKGLSDMINDTKSTISRIDGQIRTMPNNSQKKQWLKKQRTLKEELNYYKKAEKEMRLFGENILKEIPNGWKVDNTASAPKGYKYVSNGKSRFGGERKTGLVKID